MEESRDTASWSPQDLAVCPTFRFFGQASLEVPRDLAALLRKRQRVMRGPSQRGPVLIGGSIGDDG
jgi:hypothetical protein